MWYFIIFFSNQIPYFFIREYTYENVTCLQSLLRLSVLSDNSNIQNVYLIRTKRKYMQRYQYREVIGCDHHSLTYNLLFDRYCQVKTESKENWLYITLQEQRYK